MTTIDDIINQALASGACAKVKTVRSISEAFGLLMTPQGREFALKTGFPSLELLRKVWNDIPDDLDAVIAGVNILVDSLPVNFFDGRDCIVAGISKSKISVYGPKRIIHVIAMHGAEVEINASNYAVVTVTNVNAKVKIINDGTAIVTVEQTEKELKS